MCDKPYPPILGQDMSYTNKVSAASQFGESHIVYELKQKREYYISKLVELQQAIDAVNKSIY